jgi:hypothetical protein
MIIVLAIYVAKSIDRVAGLQVCMLQVKVIYHFIFCETREHHYSPTLSVVHHLPHVPGSGGRGTLSYDVGILVLVALQLLQLSLPVQFLCACLTFADTACM